MQNLIPKCVVLMAEDDEEDRFFMKAAFESALFPGSLYFVENGKEVRLTASRGILKTETKDIEVTGQVVLTYSNYTLETEQMNYDHGRRMLFSSSPVKIIGDAIKLTADSMKYDLTANQAWFQRNVEVLLRENPI